MRRAWVISIIAGIALFALIVFEHQSNIDLHKRHEALRVQNHSLSQQIHLLTEQRNSNQEAAKAMASETQKQLEQLQARLAELEKTAAHDADPPFVYPDSRKRSEYERVGYATPTKALETALWAISKMDAKAYQESLTGKLSENMSKTFGDHPEGVMPGGFRNGSMFKATGFKVLEEKQVSDISVGLKVYLEGAGHMIYPVFTPVGDEWKWSRNELPPRFR